MIGSSAKFDFTECMHPVWDGTTIFNESVTMVSGANGIAEVQLLFDPAEIVSVRNACLEKSYQKKVDWEIDNNKLRLTENSGAPFFTKDELYPNKFIHDRCFAHRKGGYILFSEGHFFHDHQLAVTYKHNGTWNGPTPEYAGGSLPITMTKLVKKRDVTLVLYGDSISRGANASGVNNCSPFMPSWGKLIVTKLENEYKTKIHYINTSKGGASSDWGLANVNENVTKYNPDLVIIGFGMNDGTKKVSVNDFGSNIKGMIGEIRKGNPDCKYILVSTILPNPDAQNFKEPPYSFLGNQKAYRDCLRAMQEEGIVLADITSVHEHLLKRKRFIDMTGNNINHPNDFLIRVYAHYISGMLI